MCVCVCVCVCLRAMGGGGGGELYASNFYLHDLRMLDIMITSEPLKLF